ncbi:hypothetical protein ACRAWD_27620 [Caulobacter segnis]
MTGDWPSPTRLGRNARSARGRSRPGPRRRPPPARQASLRRRGRPSARPAGGDLGDDPDRRPGAVPVRGLRQHHHGGGGVLRPASARPLLYARPRYQTGIPALQAIFAARHRGPRQAAGGEAAQVEEADITAWLR